MSNIDEKKIERLTADLDRLTGLADTLCRDLERIVLATTRTKKKSVFLTDYQNWYSEACLFIRQVLPDRIAEFELLYRDDPKRKTLTAESYAVRDWLLDHQINRGRPAGVREIDITLSKFRLQCQILESARCLFQTSLDDIEHILRADFDFSQNGPTKELLEQTFWEGAEKVSSVYRHFLSIAPERMQPAMEVVDEKMSDRETFIKER